MADRGAEQAASAARPVATESSAAGTKSARAKSVLTIVAAKCIDCGFCRESCPYGVVVTTFTRQHHYAILAEGCAWCGGPGRAPCEVYCPVPGAIVPAKYDPVHGLVVNAAG